MPAPDVLEPRLRGGPSSTPGGRAGDARGRIRRSVRPMMRLLLGLLVVWVVLAILGFVVKGLFWLAIVGIVLFLATGGYTAVKSRT